MGKSKKCKILYTTKLGKLYYVSDYTLARLNNEKVLGGRKFSLDPVKAKIIPSDIKFSNILDKSLSIIEIRTPSFV